MDTALKAVDHASFNRLLDIDDVRPVDASDMACLRELRDVLARHGSLARFGVTLLHKHFELAEGETLVETTESEARTQLIQPAIASELGAHTVLPTQFALAEGEAVMGCVMTCVFRLAGKHELTHVKQGP